MRDRLLRNLVQFRLLNVLSFGGKLECHFLFLLFWVDQVYVPRERTLFVL